jgi:hypothetical protein
MFAVIAAILFAIAFIIHVTSTATSLVFGPESLALIGLALLALHVAGIGTSYPSRRRTR